MDILKTNTAILGAAGSLLAGLLFGSLQYFAPGYMEVVTQYAPEALWQAAITALLIVGCRRFFAPNLKGPDEPAP